MSRSQWEANLAGHYAALEALGKGAGVLIDLSQLAVKFSESMYLAHSTSDSKFSNICGTGYFSPGVPLADTKAEAVLGTAGSIFFFVSPFRYPQTNCGLLFARSLELQHREDGIATPFDSGGLKDVFTRRDPAETPRAFLANHEMPLPDHRRYLGLSMQVLFDNPVDYIVGKEPCRIGPIGLTGGDQRRWTHEVRIPARVDVRGSQHTPASCLRASGAGGERPWGRIAFPMVCEVEGVDRETFDTPGGNDFTALRQSCLDYVHRKLQ